jgi:polar amino acid transport system substrate-binding protein
MKKKLLAAIAVAGIAALALTGCVNNSTESNDADSAASNIAVDEAAAALVPEEIAATGKLTVGTDPTYAPNEYKDDNGNIVGWEIELFDAAAAKLGLEAEYTAAKFDNIIPGVEGGKYNVGLSSFFDKVERQKVVDMVSYYTAGSQFAARAGAGLDATNLCGLTVAAQNGTAQYLEDLPMMSADCEAAGKDGINILGFDAQDEATTAVVVGKADAFVADSPVVQYAVKQNSGELELLGDIFGVYYYAMPIAKDSGLAPAIQAAIQSLIDDGTYANILGAFGVEAGSVAKSEINAEKTK